MDPSHPSLAVRISITAVMLFQVAALFVREWFSRQLVESGVPIEFARLQSAWLGFLALAILMLPYLLNHRGVVTLQFQRPGSWPAVIVISILIGLAMRVASWGIALIAAALRGTGSSVDWVAGAMTLQWQCPDRRLMVLGILTMTFATPVVEEIMNRGFILRALLQRHFSLAIPLASLLFAVLHRPEGMLAAFLFGIVAANQAMVSRSLWGPLIAHATFNLLMLIDSHCLLVPVLEAELLRLPATRLAVIGFVAVVSCTFLAIRLVPRSAPEAGAGTL